MTLHSRVAWETETPSMGAVVKVKTGKEKKTIEVRHGVQVQTHCVTLDKSLLLLSCETHCIKDCLLSCWHSHLMPQLHVMTEDVYTLHSPMRPCVWHQGVAVGCCHRHQVALPAWNPPAPPQASSHQYHQLIGGLKTHSSTP